MWSTFWAGRRGRGCPTEYLRSRSAKRGAAVRRVVIFAPSVTEPGGAAKHVRTLADGLAARGREVTLVTRDTRARRLCRSRTPAGVLVLAIPGFALPVIGGLIYVTLAPLAGLIAARGRALLIGFELASPSLAAGLVGKLTRRPYFAFTFSSGANGELELLSTRRSWPARRQLLLGAERIITQTPFAAVEVPSLLPHPRISVLPTPVEEIADPPRLTGSRTVVFTGRLTDGKGLDTLLAAWSLVLREYPDAKLVIAGQGGAYSGAWRAVDGELQATVAASPGLHSSVEFVGWAEDIPALMSSCDVYVLPSRSEGMSNGLLEACAWGRIAVASDIEANVAVLGADYPLLFTVDDAEELALRLTAALGEEAIRAEAARRVRERVAEMYAPAVLDRLEAMLDAAPAG